MENLKTILEYFQLVIRYLATGFVSVFVLIIALPINTGSLAVAHINTVWVILGLSGIAGLLVYGIHVACLDNFFYGITIKKLKEDYLLPAKFIKETETKPATPPKPFKDIYISTKSIIFRLMIQSSLRRVSDKKTISAIQEQMDTHYALLVFLYTTFYNLIAIPVLIFLFFELPANGIKNIEFDPLRFFLILIGLLILVCARILDKNITQKEFYMVENYWREVEDPKTMPQQKEFIT